MSIVEVGTGWALLLPQAGPLVLRQMDAGTEGVH